MCHSYLIFILTYVLCFVYKNFRKVYVDFFNPCISFVMFFLTAPLYFSQIFINIAFALIGGYSYILEL